MKVRFYTNFFFCLKTWYNKFVMCMENDLFLKRHGNLYLTDKQVSVLDKYNIDYNNFSKLSELIYYLEYLLNSNYLEDLEIVSQELSEFQYYNNTNK